jgi:peptidoglycan/LPS O-acetylase OafA/YrhL
MTRIGASGARFRRAILARCPQNPQQRSDGGPEVDGEMIRGHAGVVGEASRHYLPALDGLRFIAFLLVFVHHMVAPPTNAVMLFLKGHGWIGVEVFFAISGYLFFSLLTAEDKAHGRINIPHFYIRRLLRLYPLMVGFPLAMLIWQTPITGETVGRLLGIAFFSDNFLSWTKGYSPIWATGQLWTLSYEFQIYLVIPIAVLLYKSMGPRAFAWLLLGIWGVCEGARLAFILSGQGSAIWVTPFLRPESTLIGIALSLGLLRRRPPLVVTAAGIAGVVVLGLLPHVREISLWTLALYPACALICGAALWLAVHNRVVIKALSARWLVYLGKI